MYRNTKLPIMPILPTLCFCEKLDFDMKAVSRVPGIDIVLFKETWIYAFLAWVNPDKCG